MKKPNRWKYTVQGVGCFPVDMLRYDCCWPRTQDDVANMIDLLHNTNHGPVEMIGIRPPTVARWNSFLYKVTNIESFVSE